MLSEHLQPLVHWLHANPNWAGFFAFAIAFLESLAVIGSIVPGSVMMTAVGSLIGLRIIPLPSTLIFAILGAILGDAFSFALGRYFKQSIHDVWPFTRYPILLIKGEVFFQRHGGKSLFLARFVGPLRALVPVIAGAMGFPFKRYLLINILSASLWAPAYLAPGFLLGIASQGLHPKMALRIITIAVIAMLLVYVMSWLLCQLWRFCGRKLQPHIARLQTKLLAGRHNTLWHMLLQHVDHGWDQTLQLTRLLQCITALCIFLVFTLMVYQQQYFIVASNQWIWSHLLTLHNPLFDQSLYFITRFGNTGLIVTFVGCIALYLAAYRQWYLLGLCLGMLFVSFGMIVVLKHIVAMPRPMMTYADSHYSFPSGHVVKSCVFYGIFAALLETRRKGFTYLLAGLWISLIATSRLYLGAHWLSDIIGSLLLSLSLLAIFMFLLRRRSSAYLLPLPLLVTGAIGLLAGYYFFG